MADETLEKQSYDATRLREQRQREEASKRKVKVKNSSARGQRFIFDASGRQHMIGPGQETEIELTEAEAKRLEDASKMPGSTLRAGDQEPGEIVRLEEAPETPDEHKHRGALSEAERDLMQEGQDGDKERREKIEKMTGPMLAAETGIHMHARGFKPAVVAEPADAPPKKGQGQTGPKAYSQLSTPRQTGSSNE